MTESVSSNLTLQNQNSCISDDNRIKAVLLSEQTLKLTTQKEVKHQVEISKFQLNLFLIVGFLGYVCSYGLIRTWTVFITPIAHHLKNNTQHGTNLLQMHNSTYVLESLKGDVHISSSLYLFCLYQGMFLCGQLIPRLGNKLVCILSSLIGIFSLLIAQYSIRYGHLTLFYTAFICLGFIAGTILCSCQNLIVKIYTLVQPDKLTQALSIITLGGSISFFIAPPVCIHLIDSFGVINAIPILGILHVLMLIFTLLLKSNLVVAVKERPQLLDFDILKHNSNYVKIVISTCLMWMAYWGSNTWMTQWFENYFATYIDQIQPDFIKNILMIYAIGELIGRSLSVKLVNLVRPVTLLYILPIATMGLGWLVFMSTDFIQTYVNFVKIVKFIMGIANGIWPGTHIWIVSSLVRPEQNVQALGMLSFFGSFTNWLIVKIYCEMLKYEYRLLNFFTFVFYTVSLVILFLIKIPKLK